MRSVTALRPISLRSRAADAAVIALAVGILAWSVARDLGDDLRQRAADTWDGISAGDLL